MKKLFITVIIGLMALLSIAQSTYASSLMLDGLPSEISEHTFSEEDFEWQRITLDGKYAIRTLRFQIDFTDVSMEFNTNISGWENFIVQQVGSTYSRVDIYNDQLYGTPVKTYQITYEAPEATELLFLSDGLGSWQVNVEDYQGKWMSITLILDPGASITLINMVEYWMNNFPGMYDFNITAYYNINYYSTVADLPLTAGNPQQETPGMTGDVVDYFYDDENHRFIATVRYIEEYALAIENIDFGEENFIDKIAKINYYSIGDEKFFQFDFVDSEEVILTLSGEYATLWSGFAIWNLTTNKFYIYNRALALTYIDIEPDRDVFGYLYLPNINIDDMLSVSGFFSYRFGYKNIIGQQKYRAWETATFALEKDEASYGSSIFNYGVLPQWTYDAVKYVGFSNPIATLFTMIPGLEDIGFYLNYVGRYSGFLSATLTGAGAIDKVVTGKIDEIETISPDGTLREKVNELWTEKTGELIVLPTNAQLHKLYFGAFTDYNTNVVDIDEDTLTYTEITWMTDKKIYTLTEPMITEVTTLDPEDAAPPEDDWDLFEMIKEFILALFKSLFIPEVPSWLKVLIGVGISIAVIWGIIAISKFFKSAKKALKKPAVLIGLGIAIFLILFLLGYLIF